MTAVQPPATATPTERTEHPHIVRTPGVLGGDPRIVGTRLGVEQVFGYIRTGGTAADVQAAFPDLSLAQIHDAISYAYDHPEEIAAIREAGTLRRVLKDNDAYYYRGWLLNRQQVEESGLLESPEVYTWETLPPDLEE